MKGLVIFQSVYLLHLLIQASISPSGLLLFIFFSAPPSVSLPGDYFPICLDSCLAPFLATWLFNLMTAVLLYNSPTYSNTV